MIGEIEGIPEGTTFSGRRELHDANVHRGLMRGIAPQGYSIVLSGGFIDDEDGGDVVIYTGEGGRDTATRRQVADQTLTGGNLALAKNCKDGIPIRVNRGHNLDSQFAPESGYRYDGLYRIENYWHEAGVHGFLVWRYKLVKLSKKAVPQIEIIAPMPEGELTPQRSNVYSTRVIRNSEIGNYIKELYDYTCQISGVRLMTPSGPYAEACHIQPVGKSHNGPDIPGNVLCLSPNTHVLFDHGSIAITDDLKVIEGAAKISLNLKHELNLDCIRYHREHIYRLE